MHILSTGEPSTLGTYLKWTEALLGKDSIGAKFFRDKIADSPKGEDEEVIQHESQMMVLIGEFAHQEVKKAIRKEVIE